MKDRLKALELLHASASARADGEPSTPTSVIVSASSKGNGTASAGKKKKGADGGTPSTPASVGSTPGTSRGTGGKGRKGKGRARFAEFWPREVVREGLTAGHLHEGKIKVNPHRRQEAYVSLEGVPHDVKIDGYDAQNRVIDGDTVVFAIDPMNDWPALEDKTPRRKRRGGGGGGGAAPESPAFHAEAGEAGAGGGLCEDDAEGGEGDA